MATLAQQLEAQGSFRSLFPNATWMWVICGKATPEQRHDLRSLVTRDLLALGSLAARMQQHPVALVQANDPIAEWVVKATNKQQAWDCVECGVGDLVVKNPNKLCLNTANIAITYGEPSDEWFELIETLPEEKQPYLIERELKSPGKQVLEREVEQDPYARYHHVIEVVRRWWSEPFVGIKIRDEIDIRPHRKIV